MRIYGNGMRATEFTKKQVNVLYAKMKCGELDIHPAYMSHLYKIADYYGHDDNRSVEREERWILNAIEAVFAGDLKKAQEELDFEQKKWVE